MDWSISDSWHYMPSQRLRTDFRIRSDSNQLSGSVTRASAAPTNVCPS